VDHREKDARKARWTKGEQVKEGSCCREERQGVKGGRWGRGGGRMGRKGWTKGGKGEREGTREGRESR